MFRKIKLYVIFSKFLLKFRKINIFRKYRCKRLVAITRVGKKGEIVLRKSEREKAGIKPGG